jgi:hypothetical protein
MLVIDRVGPGQPHAIRVRPRDADRDWLSHFVAGECRAARRDEHSRGGQDMKRSMMLALLAAIVIAAPAGAAHAAVNVNIGLNLGAPPQLVTIPGTAVAYAPALPANYFFYAGQYYLFTNGAWYIAPTYNGPWAAVAPVYVPRPLLQVPIRYYRVPPPAWSHWRREAPPRWQGNWGAQWHEGSHERGVAHEPPRVAHDARDRDHAGRADQNHDRDHAGRADQNHDRDHGRDHDERDHH